MLVKPGYGRGCIIIKHLSQQTYQDKTQAGYIDTIRLPVSSQSRFKLYESMNQATVNVCIHLRKDTL